MATLPVVEFGNCPPNTAIPSFGETDSLETSIQNVARAVLKAKRVAVICGAGISTGSGIPDFRSTEGLFASLKAQYPEAKLTSGKDLFDASLFSSEENVAIFYTMIAELKHMVDQAEPTPFHEFLKELDEDGKLFRVYTQNIDGLEEKVGLSYGLGDRSISFAKGVRSPTKPRSVTPSATPTQTPRTSGRKRKATFDLPLPPPPPIFIPVTPKRTPSPSQRDIHSNSSSPLSSIASSPANSPAPPPEIRNPPTPSKVKDKTGIPRCIPLHGTLSTLYCPHCSHIVPIEPYLSILASGNSSSCPACTTLDAERREKGGRSRGVGRLKPDVVLYNESHKEGERVGDITRRDLMGVRPDLLLVVGTSLKVPGTKLLVREFSKVIKPTVYEESDDESENSNGSSSLTPSKKKKVKPIHVIYLNLDFAASAKEWQGVFDVWARGDVQEFIQVLEEERIALQEEIVEKLRIKELKIEKAIIIKAEKKSPKKSPVKKGKTKFRGGVVLSRGLKDEDISYIFKASKAKTVKIDKE